MTLSLAIADNGNNTGATATVTGSSPGSTNTVYTQIADGNLRFPSWVNGGSRTSDGGVALPALLKGLYWGYCLSVLGGVQTLSPLVYFGVTDGLDAIHQRCIAAVISRIQALTLAGTADSPAGVDASTGVRDHFIPDENAMEFPCITVSQEGERENIVGGTNVRDDYGYPIRVAICDRTPANLVPARAKYLKWRQQLMQAFENQRLPGVPEINHCEVTPGLVVDPKLRMYQYLVSGMTLRFFTRQPRGLS